MKQLVLLVASAAFGIGLGFSAVQAADAPKGPIKVDSLGKKPAVTFDHAKHSGAKCEDCHHKSSNDKGESRCALCHGADNNDKTKAPRLQDAAHGKDKGKCFGCHLSEKAVKKLRCAECHKG